MPPTDDELISANIRAELARRRWTVRDLAQRAGMHPATLGRRMRAEQSWTVAELRTISSVFGVPMTVLLPGVPA